MRSMLLGTASFFALAVLLLVTFGFQDGTQLPIGGPSDQRQVNFFNHLSERFARASSVLHGDQSAAGARRDPRAPVSESSRERNGR